MVLPDLICQTLSKSGKFDLRGELMIYPDVLFSTQGMPGLSLEWLSFIKNDFSLNL